jgi:hypothetical protein
MTYFKSFYLTAALLALTASTAFAGDTTCSGTIVVGPEWTAVQELPTDYPMNCRFKTASELGKRILRKCPNGSQCELHLSTANHPNDYRWDGKFTTIVKWPEGGVDKD